MTIDRQVFYNAIAQEHELAPDEVEQAIKTAINFLVLRKSLADLIEKDVKRLEKPGTIGIHVKDVIKTVDRLG